MNRHNPPPPRGRGTAKNPATRFDPIVIEPDWSTLDPSEYRQVPTTFFEDNTRTILTRNDSPDVGFTWSVNPYRGCEHGCIYCYARPSHEYLGWSAGLDFETKILVKQRAPELLRNELRSPSWTPAVVALCGNTDPYQPVERTLRLTRQCLEVLATCRNPAVIITKNHLVTRDLDILQPMAADSLVHVWVSVTTLRSRVARVMEPRTSTPERRLNAIDQLSTAGIPVGVMVGPVIPGLTDEELPSILKAAAERGAIRASSILLRLPGPVAGLFQDWLEREFPDRKKKVLDRIRSMRGGELTDSRFGHRMRGQGIWAKTIADLFAAQCKRSGLNIRKVTLRTDRFIRPKPPPLPLFPDDG